MKVSQNSETNGWSNEIETLRTGKAHRVECLPENMPDGTVWALYEVDELLHVGRSTNSRNHIKDNCLRCSEFTEADIINNVGKKVFHLPFKMACRETGIKPPCGKETRMTLMAKPRFRASYNRSQQRLRNAVVRFVGIADETDRKLLAATAERALRCKDNPPRD